MGIGGFRQPCDPCHAGPRWRLHRRTPSPLASQHYSSGLGVRAYDFHFLVVLLAFCLSSGAAPSRAGERKAGKRSLASSIGMASK